MAKNEVRVTLVSDDKSLTSGVRNAETAASGFANTLKTKLSSALDGISQKFPAVGKVAEKFGMDTNAALGAAVPAAAATAGAAIAGFAVKSISDFQNTAQEVLHFKEVAGGTAESASRWVETFNDYGVSADTAGSLVGKLARVTETAPDSIEKYGVSIAHAKDGSIDLNATLLNVIDTLHNAPDASTQAALGTAAFGKGWQDMAKVIDVGAQGIKQDFDSISGGQIFSEKDLQNSEEFRLALDNLSDAVAGVENAIGAEAIPVLTEFLTLMQELAGAAELVPEPLAKIAEAAAKFNPIALPFTAGKAALDALTGSTDQYVTAVGPVSSLTHQVAGSVADLAAQEKLDKAAKDDLAKSIDGLNNLSEQTLKLFGAMQDAALAQIDSEVGYNRAVEDVGKSLVGYQEAAAAATDATNQHGAASTEAADAADRLDGSSRTLEDSVTKAAAAAAQYAQDQANAAGATFTTQDKIDAEIKALSDLKVKFPELAPAIQAHIDKLAAIPRTVPTTVTVDTATALAKLDEFINRALQAKNVWQLVTGGGGGGSNSGGFTLAGAPSGGGGGGVGGGPTGSTSGPMSFPNGFTAGFTQKDWLALAWGDYQNQLSQINPIPSVPITNTNPGLFGWQPGTAGVSMPGLQDLAGPNGGGGSAPVVNLNVNVNVQGSMIGTDKVSIGRAVTEAINEYARVGGRANYSPF